MAAIHIWRIGNVCYWDDAENHGGFDACVPSGPYKNKLDALLDACSVFGMDMDSFDAIHYDSKPSHYPDEPTPVIDGMLK